MASSFKFSLGQILVLSTSAALIVEDLEAEANPPPEQEGDELVGLSAIRMGTIEMGECVGRAEYTNKVPDYLVRYRTGDGCQCEAWFAEDAVTTEEAVREAWEAERAKPAGGYDQGE